MFGSKNVIRDLPKSLLEAAKEVMIKDSLQESTPSLPLVKNAAKRDLERDILESWTMSTDSLRQKTFVKKDGNLVETFRSRDDAKNFIASAISEEINSIEENFYIIEGDLETLTEEAGALKDYPSHVKKNIVSLGGGKDSEVKVHGVAKSAPNLKSLISNAISSGGVVSVHHNGKHIVSIHPSDTYSARTKYGVADNEGQKSYSKTEWSRGRRGDHRSHTYKESKYTKSDVVDTAIMNVVHNHLGDLEKDTFKKNNIEVRSIDRDANRQSLKK